MISKPRATSNVLLLMSDQHRGDCLSRRNHPAVETPHLDRLAAAGVDFTRAYSATALCAPARRTLLSGQKPFRHGVLGDAADVPLQGPTLPQILAENGFQTHLVGKLHLWPRRNFYGFATADWADWIQPRDDNDYTKFVLDRALGRKWVAEHHNFDQNSKKVCAWDLEEELHFTEWCSNSALRFLRERDTDKPFFLMTSFIPPHPPFFPLKRLLDKYLAKDLPAPYFGDWAAPLAEPPADGLFGAWRGSLDGESMRQLRAAYYASIEHVDTQIGRILDAVPDDTLVIYLSDHGDMLGDHYLFNKRAPYEPSINIPLSITLPPDGGPVDRIVVDHPVELMDVAPTILDYFAIEKPPTMDGMSLLPFMRGESIARKFVHGENEFLRSLDSSMQFITDGKWKLVWYPELDWEQLFHIKEDPQEKQDLAEDSRYTEILKKLRSSLIRELDGRPEKFTDGAKLLSETEREPHFQPVPQSR